MPQTSGRSYYNHRLAIVHAINVLDVKRPSAGRSHHRNAIYAMARHIEEKENMNIGDHTTRWLSRGIATLLAEEVLVNERRNFFSLSAKARRRLADAKKQFGSFDNLSPFKKSQYLKVIAGTSTRRASAKSRSKTVPAIQYDTLQKEMQALREQLESVQAENAELKQSRVEPECVSDDDDAMELDEYLATPVDTQHEEPDPQSNFSVLGNVHVPTPQPTPEPVVTSNQVGSKPYDELQTPVQSRPRPLNTRLHSTSSYIDAFSGRPSPISPTPGCSSRHLMDVPFISADTGDGDISSDDDGFNPLYHGAPKYIRQPTQQSVISGGLLSPRPSSPLEPHSEMPERPSYADILRQLQTCKEELEKVLQDRSSLQNDKNVWLAQMEELRSKLEEAKADLQRWKEKEAETTKLFHAQAGEMAMSRYELEKASVEIGSLRDGIAGAEARAEVEVERADSRAKASEAELKRVSQELVLAKGKIQQMASAFSATMMAQKAAMGVMEQAQSAFSFIATEDHAKTKDVASKDGETSDSHGCTGPRIPVSGGKESHVKKREFRDSGVAFTKDISMDMLDL